MQHTRRERKNKSFSSSPVILTIIMLTIIIYIVMHLVEHTTTRTPAIYEVKSGYLSQNDTMRGVCVREEKTVKSASSGHINYFVGDGHRVGVNTYVYSIDNDGAIYEYIRETKDDLDKRELNDLRDLSRSFEEHFDSIDFESVADYRSRVDNFLTNLKADRALNRLKKLQKKTTLSFSKYKASETGNIAFYTDGYENKTIQELKDDGMSSVDESSYERAVIRNNDVINKGDVAYKLLVNESWYMMCKIDAVTYGKLNEKIRNSGSLDGHVNVSVRFMLDNTFTNALLEVLKNNDSYYAVLSFRDSAVRFLNYRYLTIELQLAQIKGLKIPITSVVTKTFFSIPKEYIVKGEGKDNNGVILKAVDKKGKLISTFVEVNKINKDETMAYVASDELKHGDMIENPLNARMSYTLNETESLNGVYNVNKGYSVFNYIEIADKNDQYYIVNDIRSELNEYDHIILDAGTATENMLLN